MRLQALPRTISPKPTKPTSAYPPQRLERQPNNDSLRLLSDCDEIPVTLNDKALAYRQFHLQQSSNSNSQP